MRLMRFKRVNMMISSYAANKAKRS